ncbi:DUF86 domain-containing protein [Rhodococcus sp. NPDC060090]|uniref:HepT-like ribonuclease domain-containing protein n=1 Tax=Rhodococcus sp. NPDC060090 TaxID=3347056 RepID=UPI00364600ED
MAYDAVIRQLGIVGEAAGRLSDGAKASVTGIPWPKIIGFRNLVVHEYFRLDFDEISVIVEEFLEPLLVAVKQIRAK